MPASPLPQRIVTLEKHVLFPDMVQRIPLAARQQAGWPSSAHPPAPVRAAYYSNLPHARGERLSMAGFGWHAETAIHILRLILSGTLKKYSRLKLIIGHMGETLPVMMARADLTVPMDQKQLPRTISQTLRDQVYITTSGVFTRPPLEAALATFGLDNTLFSVDYPYAPNQPGQEFLAGLQLPPADIEKLAYKNADQLLGLV